jgi:hypothetical protein
MLKIHALCDSFILQANIQEAENSSTDIQLLEVQYEQFLNHKYILSNYINDNGITSSRISAPTQELNTSYKLSVTVSHHL